MTGAAHNGDGGATLLRVRHLAKRFPAGGTFSRKEIHAVEDATFDVERGQIVALVGESGSGKSTTARIIARLTPPSGGEIWLKGHDVLKAESRSASLAYRRAVQMVFQDPFGSLNPVHTIEHHVARPLRIHQNIGGGRMLRQKIYELLAMVGLNPPAEFADKYPHELSGGQRQRVAFARALAAEPELVLADEPVSMLDVSIRIGVLNLMDDLRQRTGLAYLYITHDIASARYIADQTIVMYAGYMVEGGQTERVIASPAHPYTQLLLSAVPDPQVGSAGRKLPGRGGVPSRIDPGPGCPFAGRCPHTMDVCRTVMPDPVTVADGHWARCHLLDPTAAPGNGAAARRGSVEAPPAVRVAGAAGEQPGSPGR
ncbi:MAG: ABC transporter ATP-binding protein [Candidatus Dormibacteraeota bacterium]|nr:ABC transporter ATP-binding protein [Candidatus Dormibacteraeota bacterium]